MDTLLPVFNKSLSECMQPLLLLITSFEDHCKNIGNGLLLPDYIVYLRFGIGCCFIGSKFFTNLVNRFQVALDRYATLKKMTAKSPVLNEGASFSPLSDSSFDWDSFQSVLALLLYLNNFLLVLRRNHSSLIAFLQSHRSLFMDLTTGGDGRAPGDSTLTLSTLLLMMHSNDTTWRNSVLSVCLARIDEY